MSIYNHGVNVLYFLTIVQSWCGQGCWDISGECGVYTCMNSPHLCDLDEGKYYWDSLVTEVNYFSGRLRFCNCSIIGYFSGKGDCFTQNNVSVSYCVSVKLGSSSSSTFITELIDSCGTNTSSFIQENSCETITINAFELSYSNRSGFLYSYSDSKCMENPILGSMSNEIITLKTVSGHIQIRYKHSVIKIDGEEGSGDYVVVIVLPIIGTLAVIGIIIIIWFRFLKPKFYKEFGENISQEGVVSTEQTSVELLN